ncbi:DUF397 domain-containing protein [Streptomyces sp. NPDC049954]|uniref:DUF397 domain-containing protein n=1 Tax=Streptomyces sp. NPDC049954 TaxID=3155779 RepID=UPI003415D0DE
MTTHRTAPTPSLAEATWFKSSYSTGANNCVEATPLPTGIAVRDSKDTSRTPLRYTTAPWTTFCAGITTGTL